MVEKVLERKERRGESTERDLCSEAKMLSMRIPGAAFGKNGNIIYTDQGGDTANFFEYSVLVLSYANSIKTDNSTLTAAYGGGRINCYVRRHYFTDA